MYLKVNLSCRAAQERQQVHGVLVQGFLRRPGCAGKEGVGETIGKQRMCVLYLYLRGP